MAPLKPDVTIGPLPKFILKIFANADDGNQLPANNSCLISLEPTITEALMHFQREGVCFGIAKKGRCLIADEMGLGKTYQAIALADFYKEDWPLLICTTAATR